MFIVLSFGLFVNHLFEVLVLWTGFNDISLIGRLIRSRLFLSYSIQLLVSSKAQILQLIVLSQFCKKMKLKWDDS